MCAARQEKQMRDLCLALMLLFMFQKRYEQHYSSIIQ